MNYKCKQKICKILGTWKRKKMLSDIKQHILKKNMTIFSSNCVGGVIYNELGLRFSSPTINMFMYAEDFLKFVENWEHYVSCELIEVNSTLPYPIAKVDDILLYLVHYNSVEEANAAWIRRGKRINPQDIYIIMVDRDGFFQGLLERIDRLPYPKVLYTSKKYDFSWCSYVPDFEGERYVGTITAYADFSGHKFFDKYFDIFKFLEVKKEQ